MNVKIKTMSDYQNFLRGNKKSLKMTGYKYTVEKYFHKEPQGFFMNFLECRRTFANQYRFAGVEHNSGFYFASSMDVMFDEMAFYNQTSFHSNDDRKRLKEVNKMKRETGIIVEVQLEIDGIIDLTKGYNVFRVLTEGKLKLRGGWLVESVFFFPKYLHISFRSLLPFLSPVTTKNR